MINDRERAVGFAREALAWMSERGIPPIPDNYKLAYTYVEGQNIELKRGFDALMAVGSKFDPDTMSAQHQRYFPTTGDNGTAAEFSAKISSEVDSVLQLLAKASQDHSDYKQTLSSASGELEGTRLAQDSFKALVNKMIGATRAMETRSQELENKLQTSSQEIAELRDRLEATQQDTIRDHLTGIPNRRAFDIELKSAIDATRESAEPLSIVMFDVDHFKQFNDTWGHQTGDQVLRLVANCIADNARHSDTTTRFGGEEFAVILPSTALADAVHWANQICGIVRSKRLIKKSTGGKLGVVTVSAGVVKHRPGETDVQVVRRADTCLYAAKHAGRDRVVSEIDAAILSKAETEAA
jgi:diguanylate cyclase